MAVPKANQRAVNKYVKNNYDRINVTMPKGRKDIIQAHAAAQGESVNGFINRAISETMERDATGGPSGAARAPAEVGGGVSLPSDAFKAAREAAEASGEALPVFIGRAVETQAQRDRIARAMEKAPDKKSEA